MAGSVTVPNQFQAQNGPIPLSQLDNNFTALAGPLNAVSTFSNYYVDSSGAANTITVTISLPQTFSYTAGVRLDVKLSNTNTSSTVNINVNSLGNQAVLNGDGSSVAVGQLTAGMILGMIYNGTNFLLVGSASKSASIAPFTATSGGNVTLPAPSSGVALTVGAGAVNATQSFTGSAVNISYGDLLLTNTAEISSTSQLGIGTSAATGLLLFSAAQQRLTISATGNVVVNSPSNSSSMSAGNCSMSVSATTTAGGSFGFLVSAGTNASDVSFQVNNAANTIALLQVGGGGAISLGNIGTATTATAGGGTLPTAPVGFIVVSINGTSRKIPYYAT